MSTPNDLSAPTPPAALPADTQVTVGDAEVSFVSGRLRARNDAIDMIWEWTGRGFASVALRDVARSRTWCDAKPRTLCDWELPGLAGQSPEGLLERVETSEGDDSGFTSPHARLAAEISYPSAKLRVRFEVWVYPGCPGLRTQLWVRGEEGYAFDERSRYSGRQVSLPIALATERRRLIGYYNDPQHRHDTHLGLLKEEVVDTPLDGPEWYRWNSVLGLESSGAGYALVKESHRCVNQPGIDGGGFNVDPASGVSSDGWGLFAQEIESERYLPAWAHWHVVYADTPDDRELALKRFDRARYPVNIERGARMIANTWGTRMAGAAAKAAAAESEVLREIASQADLGIDVQQIDDGYQGDDYKAFAPDAKRYPDGWVNVVQAAKEHGVELGLWYPAAWVSPEQLRENAREGGFTQYKLDFVNVGSGVELYDLLGKFRSFVADTGHRVNCDWDVTENARRVGYFYGREVGRLYLENRRASGLPWVIYRPHLILRDLWEAAKYLNLNQLQCTIQNPALVDPDHSDAPDHSATYCAAIALMGVPVFFQETHHYEDPARTQIRELLATYKQHREAIFAGHVAPIGDPPSNRSWSGFQCVCDASSGYLTVFRELRNEQPTRAIRLRHLEPGPLVLEDLRTGESRQATLGGDHTLELTLREPADFHFLRYSRPAN